MAALYFVLGGKRHVALAASVVSPTYLYNSRAKEAQPAAGRPILGPSRRCFSVTMARIAPSSRLALAPTWAFYCKDMLETQH